MHIRLVIFLDRYRAARPIMRYCITTAVDVQAPAGEAADAVRCGSGDPRRRSQAGNPELTQRLSPVVMRATIRTKYEAEDQSSSVFYA